VPENTDPVLPEYFGSIEPVWVPDPTDTAPDRRYVDVPTTRLYGDPLYGKPRGVRFDQGLVGWARSQLFSAATGAPLVIDVGAYSLPPTVAVRIIEASGADPTVYEPDEAAELAADGRSVAFAVPPEVADAAGVYRAMLRVVDAGGIERARDEFWLCVDRGLWTTTGDIPNDVGPPTFAEVRTVLRDHPAANRLLGDYEFDPAEIGMAVVSAVQLFNNSMPPLPPCWLQTTRRMPGPWRRHMLNGTLAYLMETAAAYFRRGHLPYSAGNLAVDDLNKDRDYTAALQALKAEFQQWVRLTRTSISVGAAWGTLGSNYPNSIS